MRKKKNKNFGLNVPEPERFVYRSTIHTLNHLTDSKYNQLEQLFNDCTEQVRRYIDLYWKNDRMNKFKSSKLIADDIITHSQWKQVLYKNARITVNRAKTLKFYEPVVKTLGIDIDSRLFDTFKIEKSEFSEFIKITLPYWKKDKKLAKTIVIPIKLHRMDDKYNKNPKWKQCKVVRLAKRDNKIVLIYVYFTKKQFIRKNHIVFKERKYTPVPGIQYNRETGKGRRLRYVKPIYSDDYDKIIVPGNTQFLKYDLKSFFKEIKHYLKNRYIYDGAHKRQMEKFINRRNQIISTFVNKIDLSKAQVVYIEPLQSIEYYDNNCKDQLKKPGKLQRWIYNRFRMVLKRRCEENGVLVLQTPDFLKQPSTYASQIIRMKRKIEDKKLFYYYNEKKAPGVCCFENHYPEFCRFRRKVDQTYRLWAEDDQPTLLKVPEKTCHKKLTLSEFFKQFQEKSENIKTEPVQEAIEMNKPKPYVEPVTQEMLDWAKEIEDSIPPDVKERLQREENEANFYGY